MKSSGAPAARLRETRPDNRPREKYLLRAETGMIRNRQPGWAAGR